MENNGCCKECGGKLEYFFGPAKKAEEINFCYGRLVCQSCGKEAIIPDY